MKKFNLINLLLLCMAVCPSANASICEKDGLDVVGMFQWSDGHIFIELSSDIGCGCLIGNRVAFHKNDDEKFFMSAALTAIASGKKVFIRADNVNNSCPVHGNTPKLITFSIKK